MEKSDHSPYLECDGSACDLRGTGTCSYFRTFIMSASDTKLAGQEGLFRHALMPVAQPERLETIGDLAPAIPDHDRVCP